MNALSDSSVLPIKQESSTALLFAGALSFLIKRTPHARHMDHDLKKLFKGLPVSSFKGSWKCNITTITTDSRRVSPGALFFALDGLRTNGVYYIEEAIHRGAVAVVSREPARIHGGVSFIQVEDVRGALAEVSRRYYSHPEKGLDITGVTGTNGKTTVSFLSKHLLESADNRVGMLGTVHYDLGQRTLPAYRTTPEAIDIYAMLSHMRDGACTRAVMEVSSHGIDQRRVDGLPFKVAAFTNLTQDHIDYHDDMESYFEVKSRLFTGEISKPPAAAVINVDDAYGKRLAEKLSPETKLFSVGESEGAIVRASNLELSSSGAKFVLHYMGSEYPVVSPLLGRYNVSNVLVAIGIALASGLEPEQILNRISDFPGVPGRMELITRDRPYNVIVDYAHTDDALRNALSMLRTVTKGRLFAVFGCGGDRDRKKRPLMMTAAQENTDFVWATSDNPRSEKVTDIFDHMRAGIIKPDQVNFVEDRRRAISLALDELREGDTLLIAGKGHETFQELDGSVTPFDDRQVTRDLLKIKDLRNF